jgi:hypothetical protein
MPVLVLRGAGAGLLATLAMSAVMLGARRLGISPLLPPERIVQEGAEAVDAPVERAQVDAAAAAAHLLFGAVAAIPIALASRVVGAPVPALLALPWALTVWAGSYLGWIPALQILPPPPKDHPGRAWTMVVAHLVYGGALAAAWTAASRGDRS